MQQYRLQKPEQQEWKGAGDKAETEQEAELEIYPVISL